MGEGLGTLAIEPRNYILIATLNIYNTRGLRGWTRMSYKLRVIRVIRAFF